MPYVGGVIVIFLLMFGMYVRSIPPKAPKAKPAPMDPNFMRDMQAGLAKAAAESETAKPGDEGEVPAPVEDEIPPPPADKPPQEEETVEL